jgi:hypothetical protein
MGPENLDPKLKTIENIKKIKKLRTITQNHFSFRPANYSFNRKLFLVFGN